MRPISVKIQEYSVTFESVKKVVFILSILIFSSFGLKAQVDFIPSGGVFTESISVVLSAPEGSSIYYTLDGSVPGSGSKKYRNPISVSKVAVVRAVAYTNGKRSKVNTQSYFCDREYTLPIISVTSNPDNFWDYSRGIYVKGCCADTIEPYMGANFWKSWERSCNVEMYDKNGELCFNQQAGMSLFGGFSRALPQKSLAIIARKRYGKSKFDYPIFDERNNKKYKSFILRNSGGDFKRTHLRDAFMTQMVAPTGIVYQAYEPAVVFINGEYWGIQNIREKINEHFLAQNYGVDKNNLDILRHNGVARHGSSKNYKYLLRYLRTHDLSKDENVAELSQFMDIHDFIRYNISEVYSDNRDAGGNIRYFRERTDSAKWRWVFYDLDLGLGNNNYTGYKRNTLKKFTNANGEIWPDPAWSTFIIRKLLENQNLRFEYITTTCDMLNTVMSPNNAVKLLDKISTNIETEMAFHVKKWGTSIENWRFHLGIVKTFLKERPKYLRQHLKQKFALGNEINIEVKLPQDNNCKIRFNTLNINENFKGIYFENIPVTITVNPKHDYEFVGWKNRDEKTAKITFVPMGNIVLEPILKPKKQSVLKDSLIFNEISFYQPKLNTNDSLQPKLDDWIELYNRSGNDIDLERFTFTKNRFKNGFKIPKGFIVPAHDYIIITRNKAGFLAQYNVDSNKVIGNINFGLPRKGSHIKLYDKNELIIDSLTYAGVKNKADSLFTISLTHPDSSRNIQNFWHIEPPTPLQKSKSYADYLYERQQEAIWKKRLYIGGGSFFFICLLGIMWFRYFRKKKKTLLK